MWSVINPKIQISVEHHQSITVNQSPFIDIIDWLLLINRFWYIVLKLISFWSIIFPKVITRKIHLRIHSPCSCLSWVINSYDAKKVQKWFFRIFLQILVVTCCFGCKSLSANSTYIIRNSLYFVDNEGCKNMNIVNYQHLHIPKKWNNNFAHKSLNLWMVCWWQTKSILPLQWQITPLPPP